MWTRQVLREKRSKGLSCRKIWNHCKRNLFPMQWKMHSWILLSSRINNTKKTPLRNGLQLLSRGIRSPIGSSKRLLYDTRKRGWECSSRKSGMFGRTLLHEWREARMPSRILRKHGKTLFSNLHRLMSWRVLLPCWNIRSHGPSMRRSQQLLSSRKRSTNRSDTRLLFDTAGYECGNKSITNQVWTRILLSRRNSIWLRKHRPILSRRINDISKRFQGILYDTNINERVE